MNKSLAPLIVSFAVIILLTFVVINSKPGRSVEDQENPAEKNVLTLRPAKERRATYTGKPPSEYSSSRINPDSLQLIEKSKILLAEGDREGAEDALRTVLVFSPEDKTALSLLGGIFFRSGKYAEAEDIFKRLMAAGGSSDAATLNHLASTVAKLGRYKDAIELCMKAQEIQPDFAEAYLNLSAIYAASGDAENSSKQMLLAYRLMGYGILSYSIDPVFDKVRSMPEFQEIISRARKDWEKKTAEEKEIEAGQDSDEQN
ncbi:MAG TPA: tetratricopeptide repeat protein [Victivallales bacterium]|nr:tetratricopeptide repeat protein [Victivallales bacterium]